MKESIEEEQALAKRECPEVLVNSRQLILNRFRRRQYWQKKSLGRKFWTTNTSDSPVGVPLSLPLLFTLAWLSIFLIIAGIIYCLSLLFGL